MLRRHFNATTVFAIVALIFAMSGGAYAVAGKGGGSPSAFAAKKSKGKAKSNRGPRGPEGKQGAVGPQGSVGPSGPQGPKGETGAAGKNGEPGKNGENGKEGEKGADGTNGKSVDVLASSGGAGEACEGVGGAEVKQEGAPSGAEVCNGKDASASGMLEKGKSEYGSWSNVNASSPKSASVQLSFTLRLPASVTPHYIKYAEWSTGNWPAGCKGTAAAPEATEGNLCVFEGDADAYAGKIEAIEWFNTTEDFETETVSGTIGPMGGIMAIQYEHQPESSYAYGTWTVTAG